MTIYNDPKGQPLVDEKNYGALLKAMAKVNPDLNIVDLQVQLQHNNDDCGPWTIESLIQLATKHTGLHDYQQMQQLLRGLLQADSSDNGASDIRHAHIHKLHQAGIPVPCDTEYHTVVAELNSLSLQKQTQNIPTDIIGSFHNLTIEESAVELCGTVLDHPEIS